MIQLEARIKGFVELGQILKELIQGEEKTQSVTKEFKDDFDHLIVHCGAQNGWFSKEMVFSALNGIVSMLNEEALTNWVEPYKGNLDKGKRVGVILAGNLPAVGFHDFLSTVITGNVFVGKLSSKDQLILPFLKKVLVRLNKDFETVIEFVPDRLDNIEAIIATGSDNSSRYFEHYFGKYPNIIRKNRSSVAILSGNETEEELRELGKDIFLYYGLGCRNVSKLYVPEGYDFARFFESIVDEGHVIENNKYYNNYSYNKTIYLLNKEELLDNNFVVLRKDSGFSSPIGVLYYDYYTSEVEVNNELKNQEEKLQCIVGKNFIPFGQSQFPGLTDYADNINLLKFLTSLG